jgi:hypothetical protein
MGKYHRSHLPSDYLYPLIKRIIPDSNNRRVIYLGQYRNDFISAQVTDNDDAILALLTDPHRFVNRWYFCGELLIRRRFNYKKASPAP